jgi:hypothetical protein
MSYTLPILLFVLGAILIALSSMITANTKNLPVDSDVARCNQGIYTMAIIFMTVSVTMLAFGGSTATISGTKGLAFIITLGIVLLVLGAMIVSKTSDKAKNAAVGVLVIGIVFIVGGGAAVMTQHADKLKSFGSSLGSKFGRSSASAAASAPASAPASASVALPANFRCY